MLDKETFLGSIERDEKGYHIMKDMSQKLAILKYEQQQEQQRNKQREGR